MNLAVTLLTVARRLPNHLAVTEADSTLTYEELAARVLAIAGNLRGRGFAPGDRIVLCMENSTAFFEMLYGIWAAGLCAVPANAKLHPLEVRHIVENAGARMCVISSSLESGLRPAIPEGVQIVVAGAEDYRNLLSGPATAVVERAPEDPAWIFYTSGTTGQPKGAILSHRALLVMCHCYYADIDHLDERDTNLHAAPLSHASGLYALPHIARGGHQVILSGGFDPARVFVALEQYENVTLFCVPTMVSRLVSAAETRQLDSRNLKTLCFGGGPMYFRDLQKALSVFGPKLFQVFGQGESPMTITGLSKAQHADTTHPRYEALLASTGFPRTGVEVRVVGEDNRDLPHGEIGEILTRSDCMMLGYWGNPEATASALREGWLHTGDLGALDESGFLTLRDRSKDMIISGGSNIYPREIEEVLLQEPGVVEVSVVGRPHKEWGEEVVAFVVIKPGEDVTAEQLDAICLEHIARFKRPKDYRFVESLPKNNYGKVLKTELRKHLNEDATHPEECP